MLVRFLAALAVAAAGAAFALPPCPAPPFLDNFEAGAPGWVVDTDLNANPGSAPWTLSPDATANSPTQSFKTDASTLDQKDDRLISPPQNLTSTSHLIFWHRFNTEPTFDGGVLEVSTDGGATWVDVVAGGGVFVTGGYNDSIDPGFGSRIAGRPAWTGFSDFVDAMNKVEVNLGAFAGPARLLRWRFVADPIAIGSTPGDFWAIDDVQFTNLQCGGTAPPDIILHFHGNPTDDVGCTGSGAEDILACGGPFLKSTATLGTGPAAHWEPSNPAVNGTADQNIHDPNWIWNFTGPKTIGGYTKLQWWAACGACGAGTDADWNISVWADGLNKFTQRINRNPYEPDAPRLLKADVSLPTITASNKIVLQIDPVYADSQQNTHIYYDTGSACPGASGSGPCDSIVVFNATPPDPPPPPDPCTLPGVTVITDVTDDMMAPGSQNQDLQSVSIAELAADTSMLTFTMKVAEIDGPLPPNGIWTTYFTVGGTIYFVRMETDGASHASYSYGTSTAVATGGGTDTRVGAADFGSYSTDGSIRIKIARSKVGNPAPGQALTNMFARIFVLVGSGPTGGTLRRVDSNADQTGVKTYTVVGNTFCGTPPPPTPCVLPGITVVSDPAGDPAAPGTSQQDIRSISIAELAEDTATLTVTMKVTDLGGTLTPNGVWRTYFSFGGVTRWVSMLTDADSNASYTYGTSAGGIDTGVGAADGGSFSTDGSVQIKIARSKIGNPAPGQALTGVYGQTSVLVGGAGSGVTVTTDSAPNTVPGSAQYPIVGNTFCGTPPPQTPCALPGIKVVTDGNGDQASPGTSKQDIQYLGLAELGADANGTVTFTMKVADMTGTPTENGIWRIYFTSGGTNRWVDMESDAASNVTYNYGTSAGNLDTGVGAADDGSFLADGSIYIKIGVGKIGSPAVGQRLTAIFGRTYVLVGGAGSGILATTDSAPNTTPGSAQYTLVGNNFCRNQPPIVDSFIPSPASGTSPLTVNFAVTAHDVDNAIARYTFNFGDGSPDVAQVSPTISHPYNLVGTYTATVKVTDAGGAESATIPAQIVVTNRAPVAVLAPSVMSGESPLAVTFDGTGSSDPDVGDTLVSYAFDFGDGSAPVIQAAASANHTYARRGTYDATLRVTDSHGLASPTATVQIVVSPGPPVAQLAISPSGAVVKGDPVTFDGSFSSGDDVVEYTFDPGDGSGAISVLPPATSTSHVYRLGGSYTTTLSVRDTQDVVASTSAMIAITNTAPVAALSATPDPSEGEPPLTLSFDASGSYDPDAAKLPGEDFVEAYEFDFGDGSPVQTVSVPAINHTYTTPGTYEARLTVYDHEGKRSSNQAAWPNITVFDSAPVAVLGADPTSGFAPLTVTFDGAGSSDPDPGDGVVSYRFDFGDGSDPVTRVGASSIQHIYPDPGSYTATLVVQDSHGAGSAPATLDIDVGPVNRAPVARVTADKLSGDAPLQVAFDASASADTDGDAITEYTFAFGDGSAVETRKVADFGAQAARATHTYLNAGRYPGFVKVTDARGALSSNSDQITITATTALGENTTVPEIADEKGPFSGALSPWMLGVLGVFGLARRRRR
jgi:PKD repeat protein